MGAAMRLRLKLREINLRYPYLKIIFLIVAVTVFALLVGEWLRPHVDRAVGNEAARVTPDENTGDQVGDEMVAQPGDDQAKPTDQPTETEPKTPDAPKTPSEEKPAEETPPEPPSAPVVEVPKNTGRKVIALTFDDGPSGATTPRLLDILAGKGVKATFFVLGTRAQASPAVLQREAADGHEVESHTLEHLNLIKLGASAVQYQVTRADEIIQGIIGVAPKLVRPPYGSINNVVRTAVGKPMILWTIDPEDWKVKNAAVVRQKVVANAFDGAIILLHDIHPTTVDAVPGIIDDLSQAGYEFLTVQEMAQERGVVLQNGYSYGSFRK